MCVNLDRAVLVARDTGSQRITFRLTRSSIFITLSVAPVGDTCVLGISDLGITARFSMGQSRWLLFVEFEKCLSLEAGQLPALVDYLP
jgi:hypothetical protein